MNERSREEIETQAALYALGALNQHEARAFETHLTENGRAYAEQLRAFESVVAVLSIGAPEVEPPAHLRARLFEQLAEAPRPKHVAPLQFPFITARFADIEWQKCAPGLYAKELFRDPQARTVTTLFKFEPGTSVPRHSHTGFEQCLILQGDFIANGETFGPGDYHCATPDSTHELITTKGGAIVLIVAPYEYRAAG
jgi:anti-sigma factor ChrR (cupin superfamily)